MRIKNILIASFLSKFFEKSVEPFVKKHNTATNVASAIGPYAIIASSALAQVKLGESLSKDIKQQATQNYIKGKMIQAQARAHYDSVDAPELK